MASNIACVSNNSNYILRMKSQFDGENYHINLVPKGCDFIVKRENQKWLVHARYGEHGLSLVYDNDITGDKTFENDEVELAIANTKRVLARRNERANAAPAPDVNSIVNAVNHARDMALDAVNKKADAARKQIEEAARNASKSLGVTAAPQQSTRTSGSSGSSGSSGVASTSTPPPKINIELPEDSDEECDSDSDLSEM